MISQATPKPLVMLAPIPMADTDQQTMLPGQSVSGEVDQQSVGSPFGVVEERAEDRVSVSVVEQHRAVVPETARFAVGEYRCEVGEVVASDGGPCAGVPVAGQPRSARSGAAVRRRRHSPWSA
jgi:hypothetical protein